ncbi:hypothetical protein HDU67_010054 [Dinochytrium kinnereticum]|nr:hypothetical protein HDU67_010054 [Dinochytrium kinnereticum]
MVAAFLLLLSVLLSVITQSTASLYVVSEAPRALNAVARPDNWVGPWTLCAAGNCQPIPLPCDKETFSDGIGQAFLIRQQYGEDESRLCSRLRATRAVFLVEGILGLIALLVLLYSLSAWSLRFYVFAIVLTLLTLAFNLAAITILVIVRYNLNNLRDLAFNDPQFFDPNSPIVSYAFGWGFWITILYTIFTFLALMLMMLGACGLRRQKKKDDERARDPKRRQREELEKDEGFIPSPYPERADASTRPSISVDRNGYYRNAPHTPAAAVTAATSTAPPPPPPKQAHPSALYAHPSATYEVERYEERFVEARQDLEDSVKPAVAVASGTMDKSTLSSQNTITRAVEPIQSGFDEQRRRMASAASQSTQPIQADFNEQRRRMAAAASQAGKTVQTQADRLQSSASQTVTALAQR